MKISHKASPRNRSSLNSRSPAAGNEISGFEATAASGAMASAAPASGGPAIRSAMEVIWHRSSTGLLGQVCWSNSLDVFPGAKIVSVRESQASHDAVFRAGGGALDRNCVETRIATLHHEPISGGAPAIGSE